VGIQIGGMPTSEELRSIVNFESYLPAINDRFFSNAMSDFYWSSTTSAYNTGIAWGVYFHYGDDYNDIKVISEKEFTKVLIPLSHSQKKFSICLPLSNSIIVRRSLLG